MFKKFFKKNQYKDSEAIPKMKQSLGPALNIKVYRASGGKVVQLIHEDSGINTTIRDDRSSLYIIHDNDNFAEELSHILTRESLTL